MVSRWVLCAACLLALYGLARVDDAQANTSAPVFPEEVLITSANGCGIVHPRPPPKALGWYMLEGEAKATFKGACPQGLASGFGLVLYPGVPEGPFHSQHAYHLGRKLAVSREPPIHGTSGLLYRFGQDSAQINDRPDPFKPVWIEKQITVVSTTSLGAVMTFVAPCSGAYSAYSTNGLTACEGAGWLAYGVLVTKDGKSQITWCPDPKSPVGCEAVWEQKSAEIVARAKEVIAKANEKNANDIARINQLHKAWLDQKANPGGSKTGAAAPGLLGSMGGILAGMSQAEQLRVDPAVALAIRIQRPDDPENVAASERNAAAKLHASIDQDAARKREAVQAAVQAEARSAEAMKRSAAEKERADKAFAASLAKLGPGELFNLADAKRQEGDTDKERMALRALISRFPNHAMAGAAAQQLSRIATTPSGTAAPAAAQAKPAAAEDDMAGAMGGKKK